jgi:hypothetical protein
MHLLRDNEAAGVAFCDQLVQQAHGNPGGALAPDVLLALLKQLIKHLVQCDLIAQQPESTQDGEPAEGVSAASMHTCLASRLIRLGYMC